MSKPTRYGSLLCVLMLCAGILFAGCGDTPRPEEGSPAPPVELEDTEDGNQVRFPADWEGRAVAVSFFSPG